VSCNVAGDLGVSFEGGGRELDQLWLLERAESFVREDFRTIYFGRSAFKCILGCEMELRVLCPWDWPSRLLSPDVFLLGFRIVEANISFPQYDADWTDFAGNRPSDSIVVFEEGIEKALLNFDFFFVIEWEIMTTCNKAEVFQFGACPGIAIDVPWNSGQQMSPDGKRNFGYLSSEAGSHPSSLPTR